MADTVSLVAKLASPVALGGFRRLRVSFEVPWRVQKACRKNLLPVPGYWALRKFIAKAAVLDVYKSGDISRHRELNTALRSAPLALRRTLTEEEADQIAFDMLTAFTTVVAAGEATQAEVRALGSRMTDLYDARDVRTSAAEFEGALRAVSRSRAIEARALSGTWPEVQRFIREFHASSERGQLVRDWVASSPNWMRDSPVSALLWVASIAEDLGASNEAVTLIDRALADGASPAAFWRIRRDLLGTREDADLQKEVLQPHLQAHPIARAITSFLEGNSDAALADLESIEPGPYERQYVALIRCQVLLAAGHLESALQIADEELTDGFTAPAQFAADQLLSLGSERTSAPHFAHLNRSLELALRLRAECRDWGGRSSASALTAVRACELLGDVERAFLLTQIAPDGEATPSEAADQKIEDRRVTLGALVLRREQAQAIVDAARDSCARAEAEAILAERDEDRAIAATLWQRASEMATDPDDIFRIAFHLAEHGTVAANIFDVQGARPELIEEIKLLADLNRGVIGAAETLRGSAHSSRQLVFGLLGHLQSVGDLSLAGRVATDAGQRWADPDLYFTASEFFRAAEEHGQVVDAARNALRLARVDWPKRRRERYILLVSLSDLGRWSEAVEVAADLVAESPSDPDGRWALVICQVQLGREREAWTTYADFGARIAPRNPLEMTVRIHLWRTVEQSHHSLRELLDLADQWGNDRSVKLALVGALLVFGGTVPDDLNDRVRRRVRSILEEYPDVFIQQKFDSDDVVGSVQRMVDLLPDTSSLDAEVLEGKAPFGQLSAIHNRRLMETLAARTTPLFANDDLRFEAEVSAARGNRSADVAIDATAVMTLTYLDVDLATRAVGYAGRVKAPLRQRIDASASLDDLSSLSTMTVGRAPSGGPAVYCISEEEALARRDRADRAVTFYESLQIVERTWQSTIPKIGDVLDDFVWAESLDLATKSPDTVLWCDDFRVRQIAAGLGVSSFSTSALIEAMRREEVLAEDLATSAQTILVSHGLVGGRFDSRLAVGAAELDGWQAHGAAAFVAFGPRADDAEAQIRFVTTAIGQNLEAPDVVQQWASSMALWLVRIGGEDNAERNLVMFLRSILLQPWITGSVFPAVMEGVRAVTRERDLPDPLETALRQHFETLTLVLEHRMASNIVRGFVQFGTTEDRITATRVILT